MGARESGDARAAWLLLLLALAGCGSHEVDPRAAAPAPRVSLTAAERAAWAPRPPDRGTVPVLVYDRVPADAFARQMTLLDYASYQTISLADFVRFVPASRSCCRPGRSCSRSPTPVWTLGPAAMRSSAGDAAARSGRWEVQFGSGTGDRLIRFGPGSGDVGPFYAYRGSEEVLGGWRERVFSDLSYGEQQLAHHVHGYRSLAFAPPYGGSR